MRRPPRVFVSGGHFERIVVPQVEGIGSCVAVRGGGEAVAAGSENCVDLIVSSEEPLRLPDRLEPAHNLLSHSGWSVRPLNAVIETFVSPMISFRRKGPDRLDIAAQFVCHDDTRFVKAGDQPGKETPGSFGISARLRKDIEHIAVCIHRPPQPDFDAVDRYHNFIKLPFVCNGGTVTLDAIGEMSAKSVHPFAHGFPADGYTALSQKVLHIRRAERETMIGPDGIGYDFAGETIAFQARHLCWNFHSDRLNPSKVVSKLAIPVGEIVHRSPHLILCYYNDPDKTAEAFRNGWFHSGDLGRFDDDGYLYGVDRKKDMIKTGGENVASREVEETIFLHPKVAEVAVFGVPHPKWIEAVVAVVVPKPGQDVTAEEVTDYCRGALSAFKTPKHIALRDSLPKNASGKILKRELREEFAALFEG